jgi:hypothetical protein
VPDSGTAKITAEKTPNVEKSGKCTTKFCAPQRSLAQKPAGAALTFDRARRCRCGKKAAAVEGTLGRE